MKIIFNKEYKRLILKEKLLKAFKEDLSDIGPLSTFDKLVKTYNELLSYEHTLSELSEGLDGDFEDDTSYAGCLDTTRSIKKEYNELIESLKI